MKYYSEESIRLWQRDFDSSLDDYPCIEIKEPHGRLKDVDDIINRLTLKPMHDMISTLLSIQSAIDESPTVIPASEGE